MAKEPKKSMKDKLEGFAEKNEETGYMPEAGEVGTTEPQGEPGVAGEAGLISPVGPRGDGAAEGGIPMSFDKVEPQVGKMEVSDEYKVGGDVPFTSKIPTDMMAAMKGAETTQPCGCVGTCSGHEEPKAEVPASQNPSGAVEPKPTLACGCVGICAGHHVPDDMRCRTDQPDEKYREFYRITNLVLTINESADRDPVAKKCVEEVDALSASGAYNTLGAAKFVEKVKAILASHGFDSETGLRVQPAKPTTPTATEGKPVYADLPSYKHKPLKPTPEF